MLLAPRTAYLRRKLAPTLDPYGTALAEQFRYSRAVFAFGAATGANPDILTDADLDASSVVIDAGAYVGEWSERIVERYDATVHAFEPSHRSVERCEEVFADRPRVHVHELALGGHDGVAQLEDAGPGSALETDGGWAHAALGAASAPRTAVTVRDAAAMFDDLGLEHIDLLKLNIEGGEYDVLDRLDETGWLDRIDAVSVQFHEWHPGAHRRRARNRRALARTHQEAWCYPWVWELWSRPVSRGRGRSAGT